MITIEPMEYHGVSTGNGTFNHKSNLLMKWLEIEYALLLLLLLLQSCPTLCDSIHSSPPGSSVPGILQARTLEWVAISFSNALLSVINKTSKLIGD